MTIRNFDTENDYPAVVAVHNAVYPTYPDTEEEWRHYDAHRDPRCRFLRFVVERDGALVAFGGYDQSSSMFDPRKFEVSVAVAPVAQEAGIGGALYRHILDALAAFDPISIRAYLLEGNERALRFVADRGFTQDMRYQESWLDVASFDATRFDGAEAKAIQSGVSLTTFAQLLADSDDPDTTKRSMHALMEALHADVPTPEPHTPVPYDVWASRFTSPNFLPDASFVAVAPGGEMVGASVLWKRLADDHLQTGITGVRREWRRKGIALALKLRAIAYAKTANASTIRTDNESNNVGMLAINNDLGFVPQPAWLDFSRTMP